MLSADSDIIVFIFYVALVEVVGGVMTNVSRVVDICSVCINGEKDSTTDGLL